MLKVETDPGSGFCGGVIRAISRAEQYLSTGETLYSLGAIVHNEAELARLGERGLVTVSSPSDVPVGASMLIRAHGEPPSTYVAAMERSLTVIDCTCPVVLRLQGRIREAYSRLHSGGNHGTVVIFGRVGHAEVLGLLGQTGGNAVVVENSSMLSEALSSGLIDVSQPAEIFSQTTKSPSEYSRLCELLCGLMASPDLVTVHDTICQQVASRHDRLEAFARGHDVIIFVAGTESSNGRVLFDLCRKANPRCYRIGSASEISEKWLHDGDRVGVCGATSTPKWLLEQVAGALRSGKFAS